MDPCRWFVPTMRSDNVSVLRQLPSTVSNAHGLASGMLMPWSGIDAREWGTVTLLAPASACRGPALVQTSGNPFLLKVLRVYSRLCRRCKPPCCTGSPTKRRRLFPHLVKRAMAEGPNHTGLTPVEQGHGILDSGPRFHCRRSIRGFSQKREWFRRGAVVTANGFFDRRALRPPAVTIDNLSPISLRLSFLPRSGSNLVLLSWGSCCRQRDTTLS